MRELATERANSSRFARSMSGVSQKATLSVAFSAAGELVISRGDSAVDLQVTDHALDASAGRIHPSRHRAVDEFPRLANSENCAVRHPRRARR